MTSEPFPAKVTEAGLTLNKSDCKRVLTTSKGLVTIAPHMAPNLNIERKHRVRPHQNARQNQSQALEKQK